MLIWHWLVCILEQIATDTPSGIADHMAKRIYERLTIWEIKTNLHVYLHTVKIKVLWNIHILKLSNFLGNILHIWTKGRKHLFSMSLPFRQSRTGERFWWPCSQESLCQGWRNKLQTWKLETIEIYSLTVVEARSLTSRCQQGQAATKGSTESPSCFFQLLVAPSVPRVVAKPLQSAFVFTWLLLSRTLG